VLQAIREGMIVGGGRDGRLVNSQNAAAARRRAAEPARLHAPAQRRALIVIVGYILKKQLDMHDNDTCVG
jgi:hypothetical protein